jgi:Stress responsive A/B Barrel Domain
MRNLFFATLAAIILVPVASAEEKPDAKTKTPYVHIVIFTLKKDAPADAEANLIADCHEMLEKIPVVRELRVGRPAEKTDPKLVRKDYSVGLVILFDDFDAMNTYSKSDLHQKFVEKHLKNFDLEKLQVVDFINQAK